MTLFRGIPAPLYSEVFLSRLGKYEIHAKKDLNKINNNLCFPAGPFLISFLIQLRNYPSSVFLALYIKIKKGTIISVV